MCPNGSRGGILTFYSDFIDFVFYKVSSVACYTEKILYFDSKFSFRGMKIIFTESVKISLKYDDKL